MTITSGLISFTNQGKIITSTQLSSEDRSKLNISTDIIFDLKTSVKMRENLDYHRDVVFI